MPRKKNYLNNRDLYDQIVLSKELVAAGFCGHGMPQCFGVGKAVARMIEGGEHAAAVHPFSRDEASPARVLGK